MVEGTDMRLTCLFRAGVGFIAQLDKMLYGLSVQRAERFGDRFPGNIRLFDPHNFPKPGVDADHTKIVNDASVVKQRLITGAGQREPPNQIAYQ